MPSAVLLAGCIKLLQHQTDAAYDILKDAAHGPSGNLMSLELGWLYLQRGELPMALSTLSDEVTRNPLNIEAHCLLLECYWTARRFDEMKRLAEVLRAEKCDNTAIENAGPRDAQGQPGSYEAALQDNHVLADTQKPLELLRTIHSFDPCIACAIHVTDPQGEELVQVKVT